MTALSVAAAGAVGYLLGSFPTADIVTRVATKGAVNLRSQGSGNPGATNAAHLGYAGDVTKGLLYWGAQLEAGSVATAYQPTALSTQPFADPSQIFNTCVYVIQQKTKQSNHEVEFKLSAIIDQPQMKLPRQQVLRAEFPGAGLFRK